ncbi:MAG: nucleotidyltransferase substrate binding protein, partial [Oscillospiraceae bacterium]|nr:nucleotidyltransferase substrate binding protein [Oscillospiraceae bacterium]
MEFNEKLDITDMVKCANNFDRTLSRALQVEAQAESKDFSSEDGLFEYQFSRSAVIQVFEITVESAWKIMQRWVKINADKAIA